MIPSSMVTHTHTLTQSELRQHLGLLSSCSPPPFCSPQEEFNPDGGMWTRRILIKRPGPDAAWFVFGLVGERKRDGDSCSCCVSRLNVDSRLRLVCSLVRCTWTNAVFFLVGLPVFFILQIHRLLDLTCYLSLLRYIFKNYLCMPYSTIHRLMFNNAENAYESEEEKRPQLCFHSSGVFWDQVSLVTSVGLVLMFIPNNS